MTLSFVDQFDIPQFSKKCSVIRKRLRVLQRDLQVTVYQSFSRNQSCGSYNSENA